MDCIDEFRTSAMDSFIKLMEIWKKEKTQPQSDKMEKIEITIDTAIEQHSPLITETTSIDEENNLQQIESVEVEHVYVKIEPKDFINEDDTSVQDVKVKDSDCDSLAAKGPTSKIKLSNVLQNVYVAQPKPPENTSPPTITCVDKERVQNQSTEQVVVTADGTNVKVESCKSGFKQNLVKKRIRKPKTKKSNGLDKAAEKTCQICQVSFSEYKFNKHMKTHDTMQNLLEHDSAPVKTCQICNILFQSESSYNTHMKVHDTMVFCDVCNKWYSAKTFKMHLQTSKKHNKVEDFKFSCDECNARFAIKAALHYHIMSVHKNLRPYKCSLCPAAFVRASPLRAHVNSAHKKHQRERKHLCAECDAKFMTKRQLKAHMVRHTGERPYKCKVCLATFGYSGALFTHNRLVHEKVKKNTE
ncbi:hypothetical protein NE865_11332 [Phthorimaea operculella]|nr:hypothetical protein NE865_11332 [Phthorimaea operculella]